MFEILNVHQIDVHQICMLGKMDFHFAYAYRQSNRQHGTRFFRTHKYTSFTFIIVNCFNKYLWRSTKMNVSHTCNLLVCISAVYRYSIPETTIFVSDSITLTNTSYSMAIFLFFHEFIVWCLISHLSKYFVLIQIYIFFLSANKHRGRLCKQTMNALRSIIFLLKRTNETILMTHLSRRFLICITEHN